MIKLKNLLNLNKMVYSEDVTDKHQKKMDMQTEVIMEEDVKIPNFLPPENSSKKTRGELQWLVNYNEGLIDKDYVKEGDSVSKVFEKYCNENNLEFDKKFFKKVLKESGKFILKLKYHYNRPRPYQLAEFYGIEEFKDFELPSMKTPSYPSGHSTQGYLLSGLLSMKYPNQSANFDELAEFISNSRLMARAHYPSDISFGKKVAMYLVGGI